MDTNHQKRIKSPRRTNGSRHTCPESKQPDRTMFKVLAIFLGLLSVNASCLNIQSILEYSWHPLYGKVLLFLLTSGGFCIFIGWKKPKTKP